MHILAIDGADDIASTINKNSEFQPSKDFLLVINLSADDHATLGKTDDQEALRRLLARR